MGKYLMGFNKFWQGTFPNTKVPVAMVLTHLAIMYNLPLTQVLWIILDFGDHLMKTQLFQK